MAPSMTCLPPYHRTTPAIMNVKRVMTGINTERILARRSVPATNESTATPNRPSSRSVRTKDFTTRIPEITSSMSVERAAV